jgi:hypothetical protein
VITHKRGGFVGFAIFGLYAAISLIYFARALPGHLDSFYLGRETDPPMFIWYIRWWRYAFDHRINPFLTDLVWAPRGTNLAWSTLIPLPAWLVIPVGRILGETASYNLLCIVAFPLAAFSAFLLCRHVTGVLWASILGGYVFAFSPYMLGQMLAGHLNLILVFPVPLIALLTLKRLDREISARRFAIALAGLLTIQFLCSVELFATVTIVGGFAVLLALALFDGDLRTRLAGLIAPAIAGYAIAAALLSPYLFYLLALGYPHAPIWIPGNYSADLLGFLVPTESLLVGTARAAIAITRNFQGNASENGAYLGIAIILIIEIFRRRYWHEPVGKFLTILLVVIAIASMGPSLHVLGRAGIWMPWAVAMHLPFISIALPIRFMIYASLIVAVMVSMCFAASNARTLIKCVAAAVILLSIAPNPTAPFWLTKLEIPAFFTDGSFTKELSPREIILPLPFSQKGNCMYWQVASNMYFRMAGAWTGVMPFEFQRMPVVNYFYGGIDLPEAADQLKAYLARFEVQAVVADPTEANFSIWQQTLAALDIAPLKERGVWIYKIPPGSFAPYGRLSGTQVEARADALRFDTILEAAGKYLADGHELSKLSPLELKRLDLLPHDWLVDAAPDAYKDWQIAPARADQVGIIIVGSYEGVRPLIERYRAIASELDYPAPTRWTPDSHPRLDVIKPLLITFDFAHLTAAARSLRDSPPPERTTPFVAGVAAGL